MSDLTLCPHCMEEYETDYATGDTICPHCHKLNTEAARRALVERNILEPARNYPGGPAAFWDAMKKSEELAAYLQKIHGRKN